MKALLLDFCRNNFCIEDKDILKDGPPELLIITGNLLDEHLLVKSQFHVLIQQNDFQRISEEQMLSLSLKHSQFKNAILPEEFVNKYREIFEFADTLVIWNRTSFEYLREYFIKHELDLKRYNHIILQECLISQEYGEVYGLYRMLKKYKISCGKEMLRRPSMRLKYLLRLFRLAYVPFRDVCRMEPVYVAGRKVLHHKECPHIICVPEQKITQGSFAEIFSGMRICKDCARKYGIQAVQHHMTERKILRSMNIYDALFAEMASDYFDIKCITRKKNITVQTDVALWKIYHKNGVIQRVMHESVDYGLTMREKVQREHDSGCGFHKQQIKETYMNSIFKIINYIKYHDLKSIEIAKEQCV